MRGQNSRSPPQRGGQCGRWGQGGTPKDPPSRRGVFVPRATPLTKRWGCLCRFVYSHPCGHRTRRGIHQRSGVLAGHQVTGDKRGGEVDETNAWVQALQERTAENGTG
ncbi:unnamed protein product [Ectocarpus sp. 12 AP-2014]